MLKQGFIPNSYLAQCDFSKFWCELDEEFPTLSKRAFEVIKHFQNVSSTLKKPSRNYPCFILRRFGLFLFHPQSKNKATLGNASNSKPKDSVTQEITVRHKRRQKQNQDR